MRGNFLIVGADILKSKHGDRGQLSVKHSSAYDSQEGKEKCDERIMRSPTDCRFTLHCFEVSAKRISFKYYFFVFDALVNKHELSTRTKQIASPSASATWVRSPAKTPYMG